MSWMRFGVVAAALAVGACAAPADRTYGLGPGWEGGGASAPVVVYGGYGGGYGYSDARYRYDDRREVYCGPACRDRWRRAYYEHERDRRRGDRRHDDHPRYADNDDRDREWRERERARERAERERERRREQAERERERRREFERDRRRNSQGRGDGSLMGEGYEPEGGGAPARETGR